jgi:hypothetical protein
VKNKNVIQYKKLLSADHQSIKIIMTVNGHANLNLFDLQEMSRRTGDTNTKQTGNQKPANLQEAEQETDRDLNRTTGH